MEPSAAPRQSSQGRGGSATSPIGLHGAGAANSRRQLRAAARHRHSASAWLGLGYHKLLTRAQRVCSARWAVTAEKPLFIDKRLGLSARETQDPYLRSSDRVDEYVRCAWPVQNRALRKVAATLQDRNNRARQHKNNLDPRLFRQQPPARSRERLAVSSFRRRRRSAPVAPLASWRSLAHLAQPHRRAAGLSTHLRHN